MRHTKIESSLVKQQTLLCKQLVEEVVSCQRSQSAARRVGRVVLTAVCMHA